MKFIDLFAGIGGIRLGLELALEEKGYKNNACVFTSEIKSHAICVLKQNHPLEEIVGDITKVQTSEIPDFDILCAGFPCQAFSSAGNRDGFADTRGTMFFEVERILKDKKPKGFILENVEGLVNHDKGNTLKVILSNLQALGYYVSYSLLNSKDFGVPQERKRIYIVGSLNKEPDLEFFPIIRKNLSSVLEKGKEVSNTKFVNKLLSLYSVDELKGKSIKDKRGGFNNIHSWDLEMKGSISKEEKSLLNMIMTERRKKKWAQEWGIDWMDGMPLTKKHIETFFEHPNLQNMLDHLTELKYIRFEHPKKTVVFSRTAPNGKEVTITRRVYDESKEKGYNIVAGKLSFEVGKILDPNDIAPTLVATDVQKLYVPDGKGIRNLTLKEGLRLFGYPESFNFALKSSDGFDLLGNTVVVPVIKAVALRLLDTFKDGETISTASL